MKILEKLQILLIILAILQCFATKERENANFLKKEEFLFFPENKKRKTKWKEEMVTYVVYPGQVLDTLKNDAFLRFLCVKFQKTPSVRFCKVMIK